MVGRDIERDLWRDTHEVWKADRAKILADKKADSASKRADLKTLGPDPPAPLRPHIVASAPTIEGIVKHLPELRASLGIMSEEGGALIGGHAMRYHLPGFTKVTDAVAGWRDHPDGVFALPHPSWRNTGWLKKNPWFEAEVLPRLKIAVKEVLDE